MIRIIKHKRRWLAGFIVLSIITFNLFIYEFPINIKFINVNILNTYENPNNLKYSYLVENKTNKEVTYKLTFARVDSKLYPYIENIPKLHTSDCMVIEPHQTKFETIGCEYEVDDNRYINTSYKDVEVEIEIIRGSSK